MWGHKLEGAEEAAEQEVLVPQVVKPLVNMQMAETQP